MVLDLLSFISLFFFTFFSAFCFFFCSWLPCCKVASMLERCSIFYRQLVGRTVQQKVPLVQTRLLKYGYPIYLLHFFKNKLNYIFHNCLWETEAQPTGFIHASDSGLIPHIQWLLCLRLNGFGVWGGVVLIFLPLLLRYVWVFCCSVFIFL